MKSKNMKRSELHLHTKCSDTVSVISPEEAMAFAIENSCGAVAFTSRDSVQDFSDIAAAYKKYKDSGLKVIYGAEVLHADEDGSAANGVTVLVKNQAGLKGLYKIISSIEFVGACDLASLDVLKKNRKNLLFGSCGNYGLLYDAIYYDRTNEQIERIAVFYDYFEIFPTDDLEEKEIYKKIYELGEKLGVPVVAAGNCHYVLEEDEVCRRVVRATCGYANDNKKRCFHTTEQMLKEFSYLGEEAANKVVIENPNLIADLVEEVSPVKEGFYPPEIENADQVMRNLALVRAREIYGESLPAPVAERLETEIALIINNGYSYHYVIAHRMAKHIKNECGSVDTRAAGGSSFVAFLLGITQVNPLKPHYYCPHCHHFEFGADKENCLDLDKKNCPVCSKPLKTDGYNIPCETFMGCDGSKIPDIDLVMSASMTKKEVKFMKSMFGEERLAYAGSVFGMTERQVELILFGAQDNLSQEETDYVRNSGKLLGVKRRESRHPGGIIILPEGMEFEDFTPVRKVPQNDLIKRETHLDFRGLHNTLLKLDVIGNKTYDLLELVKEYTGKSAEEACLTDPVVLEKLCQADALAIPNFDGDFMRETIAEAQPQSFDDLVKIVGFAHGTNVWLNNAENLVAQGKPLKQMSASREDIFLHLTDCGIDRKDAFRIEETVRRGRFSLENAVNSECVKIMQEAGVEYWYIDSLKKIRYMFNKAHAVSLVVNAARCVWFKHYYPAEYYAAYLTCHFGKGKELHENEKWQYDEVIEECRARGIELLPPVENFSRPKKYIVHQGKILMPL